MTDGGQEIAAFVGAIALTAGGVILAAPPICRLLAHAMLKHAAGLEKGARAYREEWKEKHET